MMSCNCYKIGKREDKEKKAFILSNQAIYLYSIKARKYLQSNIKYVIKSTSSTQILLYLKNETDCRVDFENEDDQEMYFNTIIMNYTKLCPKVHLKVYGVPDQSLTKYKASGNIKNDFLDNSPDDKFRIRELEVETEEEFDNKK